MINNNVIMRCVILLGKETMTMTMALCLHSVVYLNLRTQNEKGRKKIGNAHISMPVSVLSFVFFSISKWIPIDRWVITRPAHWGVSIHFIWWYGKTLCNKSLLLNGSRVCKQMAEIVFFSCRYSILNEMTHTRTHTNTLLP